MQQTTDRIIMVRPASFGFNPDTAKSNTFQKQTNQENLAKRAVAEFNDAVKSLQDAGIHVTVLEDSNVPKKPDAVFPNNWFSTHEDGQLVLYPMCAPNRRFERDQDFVELLSEQFDVSDIIDLSNLEDEGIFLEGTGSMILDRENRLAYACYSERTEKALFAEFCSTKHFEPIGFHAVSSNGRPIYHTNVMMCLGKAFVVICLETIHEEAERKMLSDYFKKTGKVIVDISEKQMNQFAGNMLQLTSSVQGELIVMSQSAFEALSTRQLERLSSFGTLLPLKIPTIESVGGGSARCMIAENFLPVKP